MAYTRIPATGGVNLLEDARLIRDDELRSARNLAPGTSGRLRKRNGTGIQGAAENLSGADLLLSVYGPRSGSVANLILALKGPGGSYITVGSTGVFFSSVGSYTNRPQFAELSGNTYIATDLAAWNLLRASATTLPPVLAGVNFAGVGNGTIRPRLLTPYRRRMVYADLGGNFTDYLLFSDPDEPLTIGDNVTTTNGRAFRVGHRNDGRLMGLVEVMQTAVGAPSEAALLVLRERAAYLITGEPLLSNEPPPATGNVFGTMNVSRFNVACGCASPDSIVRTPYGVVWASTENVWLMREGSVPVAVGDKIRPALQASPAPSRDWWVAAYHDGFYRLGLGTNAAVPEELNEQWWLDLSEGAPPDATRAQWWGPQVYGTALSAMSTVKLPGGDSELRGGHRAYNDVTWRVDVVNLDAAVAVDTMRESTLGVATAYPVHTELLSKEYGADALTDKQPLEVELNVETDRAVRVTAEVLLSGGRERAKGTVDFTGPLVAGEPQTATIGFYDVVLGKTWQLRLTDGVLGGSTPGRVELGDINVRVHEFKRRR